jgi:hypothetical protein
MLLVKKFGTTTKKIIPLFFLIISIVFASSSYQLGLFTENGVGSGFTPFFVSLGLFITTIVLFFQKNNVNIIVVKNVLTVLLAVVFFWLSLLISPFLLCFAVGIFSFVASSEPNNKKIKYSSVLTILCLFFLVIIKFLGIEIG